MTRLFATANKNGRYEDKAIYGQGMLDLGSATSPVGETGFTLGNTAGSPSINIQMTSLRLGGALGDGLGRSLSSQEIVAFDSLGAPFWFKLAGFTGVARGPSALVRLRELTARNPITKQTNGRLTTFTPDRAGGSVEQDLGYAMLRFGFRERPTGVQSGAFCAGKQRHDADPRRGQRHGGHGFYRVRIYRKVANLGSRAVVATS